MDHLSHPVAASYILSRKHGGDMRAIGHPNILDYRFESVFDGSRWERVMIVETDIQLDSDGEGYSAEAEAGLLSFLENYLQKTRVLTRTIELTTIRLKQMQAVKN